MNPNRKLAEMLIKIAGLFSLILSIPTFQRSFTYLAPLYSGFDLEPMTAGMLALGSLVSTIALFLLGILLIIRAASIAERMVPNETAGEVQARLSSRDGQAIAFSVVGVLVLAFSIPELIEYIAWSVWLRDELVRFSFTASTWLHVIRMAAQFLIGLGLFLKARGMANFWHMLQEKTRPMRHPDSEQGG